MKKYFNIKIMGVILASCLAIINFSLFAKQNNIAPNNDFNIVLITIDALRADHLSCYGCGRRAYRCG